MNQTQMQKQAMLRPSYRQTLSRSAAVHIRAENTRCRSLNERVQHVAKHIQLPGLIKPAALAAVTNLIATLPAHAEAGKIFDFNLTLPIMVTEFLLLMVFLEKTWFTPVGNVLDERDKNLRDKLGSVKDNSSELENLQKEAEEVISKARAEASSKIQAAKKATEDEIQAEADELKKKLDKELESALAKMDSEQNSAVSGLDERVEQQVNEVLARILPEGVTLPKEQQQPMPVAEEEDDDEEYFDDDDGEWEEEEQLEGATA